MERIASGEAERSGPAVELGFFVRHYDSVRGLEAEQALNRRVLDALALRRGERVIEIGCGTGDDTIAMARRVGRNGRAVGVDLSQPMIDEAQRRATAAGVAVEFVAGDAHRLDYPDGTFDAACASRVFMHLADPAGALHELVRVVRPGGRLVVSEPDLDSFVIDLPDQALTRRLLAFRSDSSVSPWIGRQLPRLFKQAGLVDVAVTPVPFLWDYQAAETVLGFPMLTRGAEAAGAITPAEAAAWLESLRRAADDGVFFCASLSFMVLGRVPFPTQV